MIYLQTFDFAVVTSRHRHHLNEHGCVLIKIALMKIKIRISYHFHMLCEIERAVLFFPFI